MTESTALADIRRLELEVARQLESATAAAHERIERARQEAQASIAAAARDGRIRADEKYEIARSDAEAQARQIRSEGRVRAEALIADTMPRLDQAVEALVELVLSRPHERET